jgi:hypothetical protein
MQINGIKPILSSLCNKKKGQRFQLSTLLRLKTNYESTNVLKKEFVNTLLFYSVIKMYKTRTP